MSELDFYKGKKVFVTGHTGFKGSWLCRMLINAGAEITGYSLPPQGLPCLYESSAIEKEIVSLFGDIRNYDALYAAFDRAQPEIVFHLAAQPIVRESYKNPAITFETNVMGTVNLLECVRKSHCVKSVVNVTTDKVYRDSAPDIGCREGDVLGGFDPYSGSKSCSELVTQSYVNSFFSKIGAPAISTARAGNVVGGGDFAKDRIIPDCVRAVQDGNIIAVRNPYSTRPYQHALEPLFAYLLIAQCQYDDRQYAGCYNVAPDECISTGKLVDLFCQYWGEGASWESTAEKNAPHEADHLILDCTKIKKALGWKPRWSIETAMKKTVALDKAMIYDSKNVPEIMDMQLAEYLS